MNKLMSARNKKTKLAKKDAVTGFIFSLPSVSGMLVFFLIPFIICIVSVSYTHLAILISHRLSNVKTADNILVIGDGKIIEQGNHKELMKLNGKYARMYNLQAKKYSEITV